MEIARQWVAKARNDLLNADNNLKASEIPFDTVCFHCQQAAEKLLKAYLAANGQTPPATHDLMLVLEKRGLLTLPQSNCEMILRY
jgi:HEPN domain-containing protein